MSGDIQYSETFNLININELNYGLIKYDNKLSSDVERMITFDLEVLNNLNIDTIKIIKKQFKNLLKLCRKYSTCYWYINEVDNDTADYISEQIIISDKINVSEKITKSSNYIFWFESNNKKTKISTYSEAMKLHLDFLDNNNYNMSALFLNIAKRMNDNPSNINS